MTDDKNSSKKRNKTDQEPKAGDDDGLTLVQEVLKENPPEERGVREEWQSQVGWHRTENIRGLRGSSPLQDHTINNNKAQTDPNNGIPTVVASFASTAFLLLFVLAGCFVMTSIRKPGQLSFLRFTTSKRRSQ
eukprot:scaffold15032_cov119-Cylindrotheca_fusiformis.AAC.4